MIPSRTYKMNGLKRTLRMKLLGVTGLKLIQGRSRATLFGLLTFNVPNAVALWLSRPTKGWFLLRIAVALLGVGVMYLEGQLQPAPGIGFAFGLICIFGAALPWSRL